MGRQINREVEGYIGKLIERYVDRKMDGLQDSLPYSRIFEYK